MFFLAGAAAGSAIDLIASLKQSFDAGRPKSGEAGSNSAFNWLTSASGSAGNSSSDSSSTGTSATAAVSPGTLRALLWAQSQGADLSSRIFAALDADGSGGVSEAEFEDIFARSGDTTKADAAFTKLDTDKDGSISASELASGLRVGQRRGDDKDADGQSDSASTVTNADGSTTTTISYADGSQVTMTRPASATDTGMFAGNFLERIIQRQAALLTQTQPGQALAMSA